MLAVSQDNNITFKNVCGGVRLQFKGVDKIKSIRLEGLGNEKISGKATVVGYVDGSKPGITMTNSDMSYTHVTLDCGEGVQLSETTPTDFIIAVPPVEFTLGMKITVTDTDGYSRTLTNSSANTIKRSWLTSFPVITYKQEGVFELPEGTLTSYRIPAEGGTIEIPLTTNLEYEVVIPKDAQEWISVAETKALRNETVILNIAENTTKEERTAEVLIAATDGTTLQTITISQEAGRAPSNPNDYIDEYGINHGQGIEIDGVVWAPVNCGYHATDYKYGKLYQWGRKYGQGYEGDLYDGDWDQTYSDALVPSDISGHVSLSTGQSASNSNKFYYNSSSPSDWVTPQDGTLWNSGTEDNPIKTEYDPCPEGWRVPTYAELNNLQSQYWRMTTNEGQSGCMFRGILFFPAAGYIDAYRGTDYARGKGGHYWSSEPYDPGARYLDINVDGGYGVVMAGIFRANGCSVRCVKERTASSTPSEPETVNLSAEGTANCYTVSNSGSYKFTPTKGNSNESVGQIASAEVLWESFGTDVTPNVGDLVTNAKYEDGVISFETPSEYKEGNAVIAAKDARGKILWSWHIWLTDQPKGQEYYNNAGTMMDRNLGATSATPGDVGALGLHYQWGRKDPFLGSSSISGRSEVKSTITWPSAVTSNSSNGTIEYAISQPTTFIKENINTYNYDWYYTGSSTGNTRWTTSDKTKSVYDPCPSGWRVPDGGNNGVWSKALGSSSPLKDSSVYDSTNYGMNLSGKFGSASTIWYPVSGYRVDYNGAEGLVNPGFSGGCWSASYNDGSSGYAYYLYILSEYGSRVDPSISSDCACGHPVRCIQEVPLN